jgi:hypothetical protein
MRERPNCLAIEQHRIQQPRVLLELVVKLLDLLQVLAHPPHRLREAPDGLHHLRLLEVAQHLLSVAHGRNRVQRRVEERLELVLLPAGRHRLQHLIEIQVGEEVGLLELEPSARLRVLEEDTLELRLSTLRSQLRAGRRAIRGRSCLMQLGGHQLPPGSTR